MSDRDPGLLVVWMDADPAGEADFNAWYSGEHLHERVGVPGFVSGCRYVALRGTPHYFAAYDTETPAVLSSAPYRARLNDPTPWTQRVMLLFRNTVRATCRVFAQHGRGFGGVLRTVRIEPQQGRRDNLRAGLQVLVSELSKAPGLLRIRAAEIVGSAPVQTAEVALRGADIPVTFSLLLDGEDEESLDAACAHALGETRLQALGAALPVHVGDYRLLYALGRAG